MWSADRHYCYHHRCSEQCEFFKGERWKQKIEKCVMTRGAEIYFLISYLCSYFSSIV